MEISGYHRKVRSHAELLLGELERRLPSASTATSDVAPLLEALNIRLIIDDRLASGCSVAGSCDHRTQTITVVRAGRGRMRFTALHELGHLLGEDLDSFQDDVYEHAQLAGGHVEEDACDAFSSMILLPDDQVESVLAAHGLSARGFRDLIRAGQASMEASAVAISQRLASPGFVLLLENDGATRFAARSGDVFPIRRGTDQSASDLRPMLVGSPTLRTRGSLRYAAGSETQELYLDAVEHDGLILAVACESDPDWPQLQTPAGKADANRSIAAYCTECGTDFTSWRVCNVCGDPRHDTCGRCSCEASGVRGERRCSTCFQMLPPRAFAGEAASCSSCTG